mmetsp:Transcript_8290/g.15616  ORF Transcript_8290/g.15616 Transcript_8290/m.15616 type:complete len:410 (-) Transcript_8290:1848-3077(-)
MIVRRYIHEILSKYYQQPQDAVVGSIQNTSINFKNLLGEWDWRRKFHNLYKRQSGQWLTPVELFRPFYSQVLAKFIANEAIDEAKIHIVEIGGGRGTNALCILDYLEKEFPDVYRRCRYTLMDASPTLLELQKEVIMNAGRKNILRNDGIVDFRHIDMMDVAEGRRHLLEGSDEVTVLLAMEVFDNLPHDKISICSKSGRILQTEVHRENESSQELKEILNPLDDPLITRMLDFNPSYMPNNGHRWIPSVAGAILDDLFQTRPNASLIIADFDYLPASDILLNSNNLSKYPRNEQGEPLITDMNDTDYESYLTVPPLCDILFPTDFNLLRTYIEAIMNHHIRKQYGVRPWNVSVKKQSQFIVEVGPKQVEDTTSRWTGFSPLLDDFSNCSVLYVSRMDAHDMKSDTKMA